MFPAQIPRTDPGESIRCRDSSQSLGANDRGDNKNAKADAALAHEAYQALWKDSILRALDYNNIEIRAKNAYVSMYGHVTSLTNQQQAEKAIQSIDGVLGIKNHLIPDDRLVAEVATALGSLEHKYDCKFFTGVSHGVVLLSGDVDNTNIKLLAEKCAASNPNVRGVVSSVQVRGSKLDLPGEPFLQPSIGAEISFLDGISGRVRQVIINPDNRRVVAMTIQGRFTNQRQQLKSFNNDETRLPERILAIPMTAVRHLTRASGFLNIHIKDTNRYMEFDADHFFAPNKDWKAPYPYCAGDVLFPFIPQDLENQSVLQLSESPLSIRLEEQSLKEELLENDSLGG
jgi:osmotically-inducible protein OsmY